MLKQIFDIVFSICSLFLLLPLFPIIALLIKMDSPGPVFYKGIRSGRYGKVFYILKFRTMFVNSEKEGGDTTAYQDPRVTRIGTFLRRYKIDEIPQLINVLKGDMSIVGPRPELVTYTEQYDDNEKCILNVKPGITDISSVTFSSLETYVGSREADGVFEEVILPIKNQLRVKYVQERTFLLDIKIIIKTAIKLLSKICFKHS
jgi:lipopolysaccharide/colanic/teichoic acid biosynthesis glycosyltransferase